ncbi:MAG: STAS domain-containing protein, partial [Fibrobacterota bacterium]
MKNKPLVISEKNNYTWIELPESISPENISAAKDQLDSEVRVNSESRIVLDFKNLEYIYSTGLGLIVQLGKKLSRA